MSREQSKSIFSQRRALHSRMRTRRRWVQAKDAKKCLYVLNLNNKLFLFLPFFAALASLRETSLMFSCRFEKNLIL